MEKEFVKEGHIIYERAQIETSPPRFMTKKDGGLWESISWSNFLEFSAKIAAYFQKNDIGFDDKVAIYAKNMAEWAYIGSAIHGTRSVFVPVYMSSTQAQAKHILEDSDAHALFIDKERLPVIFNFWEELPKLKKIIVMDVESEDDMLKELEKYGKNKPGCACSASNILDKTAFLPSILKEKASIENYKALVDNVKETDVASILYTSGTTGQQKGVVLTLKNLYSNAADWIDVLGNLMPEEKIDLLWLPMSHIFGWGELGLGNTLGFTSYMTTHTDVLKDMPQVRPTIFISVPAYWEALYLMAINSSPKKDIQIQTLHTITGGRLKFCLSGGAGLKRQVKEFFYDAGLLIIEGYGLTECSPTLTMNSKDAFDFDTVGKPFPSVQLKLNPDGELLAKGPNVFSQYYKNPEATAEVFTPDGWFKTGDLVEFTDKGFLKIKGRKKDIIVTSGGKNISPQTIEALFNGHPYIEHIVLYGDNKKYLTALITLKSPVSNDVVQQSIDSVNEKLASYETIKKYVIYDGHLTAESGFLTAALKLKRHKVHEAFKDQLDALYLEE